MRTKLRHYNDEGVIHIAIISVIVVILIVVAAVVVYAWSKGDDLDGGVDPADAYAVIKIDTKVGDFDNQIGQVEARNVIFKVKAEKVEVDSFWSSLSFDPALFGFLADEFDVKLTVRCVGPNDFTAEVHEEQHVQVDEWTWGETPLNFNTLRIFVPQKGDYTLTAEIVVDAPDEGVDKEVAWSQTKRVTVEVW